MKMYNGKKIEKSLKKKGFVANNGDHEFLTFVYNGKNTIVRTKLSYGSKQPGRDILTKIRKQLKLNLQIDFERLIDCDMNQQEFEKMLKKQGILN